MGSVSKVGLSVSVVIHSFIHSFLHWATVRVLNVPGTGLGFLDPGKEGHLHVVFEDFGDSGEYREKHEVGVFSGLAEEQRDRCAHCGRNPCVTSPFSLVYTIRSTPYGLSEGG